MSFFIELLRSIWNYIKRIFLKVVNFTRNILSFFKDPNRLKKLKEDRNLIAVSIKDNYDKGNYNIVNCLFDRSNNTIVDTENDALGIETEYLDRATANNFGDKDMIILA